MVVLVVEVFHYDRRRLPAVDPVVLFAGSVRKGTFTHSPLRCSRPQRW